jgi:hypothetical protein
MLTKPEQQHAQTTEQKMRRHITEALAREKANITGNYAVC